MDRDALIAAATVLLRHDFDQLRANSTVWEDLSDESQEVYLLRAEQVVSAYERMSVPNTNPNL